jgi:hypothetical protein
MAFGASTVKRGARPPNSVGVYPDAETDRATEAIEEGLPIRKTQRKVQENRETGKSCTQKGEAMTQRELMELQGEVEESHALITRLEANREPNADALEMLWRCHLSLVARYDRACERLRP